MTDHQLARSTAEKIHTARKEPWGPDGFVMVTPDADQTAEIILASYHERDRAATAMGGETASTDEQLIDEITCGDGEEDCKVYPSFEIVSADFARTLERELNDAKANLVTESANSRRNGEMAEKYLSDLTALQESNREVVAENKRHWKWAVESQTIITDRPAVLADLRSRLALADELLNEAFGFTNPPLADAISAYFARWTAPQAGTQPMANETVFFKDMDEAMAFHKKLHEPASQAIPITPETPPVFPCWLWNKKDGGWHDCRIIRPRAMVHQLIEGGYTYWLPDQPTAPTSRPTATEGGV